MYIVTLKNGDILTEIHNEEEKLKSGSVVQGINTIDSFSFTLLPSNIGFNLIQDFQTLVTVFNTNTGKYEFHGRVLYSRVAMETSGLITKEVTCESFFGFLCDSVQDYVEEQNWTVAALLQHIISCHNTQVEKYKQFKIGSVDSSLDNNDNTYVGIQRQKSWDCIKEKLLNRLGGEIRFRVEEDGVHIDYVKELGETVGTEIALSKNMKAIAREHDPSTYVTRLYPYGCKLKDAEGNDTEQRLDVSSVNDGKKYIDDEDGIAAYGIHAGFVEFDDVTTANMLLTKGRNWMAENNLLQVKYSITALDLSLLGLDINSFEIYNRHPIKNHLISVEDTARIIKKTLNICEEVQSTIEVGDNFKTLTDIQNEQAGQIKEAINIINNLQSTTNVKVEKAEQAADDARKVATNYLDFAGKHGEGLVIGALTEETLGRNIQLSGDSIRFRDGQTILAEYSADEILLGRSDSRNMLINTEGINIRKGTNTLASFEDRKISLGLNGGLTEIELMGGYAKMSAFDTHGGLRIESEKNIFINSTEETNINVNGDGAYAGVYCTAIDYDTYACMEASTEEGNQSAVVVRPEYILIDSLENQIYGDTSFENNVEVNSNLSVNGELKVNGKLVSLIDHTHSNYLPLTGGTITNILTAKFSNIDASKADNGVSSTQYPTTFDIRDKAGRILTRQEAMVQSDGLISAIWYVRNYDIYGEQVAQKGIRMSMDKVGTVTYDVSDGQKFLAAIGGLPLTGGAMTGQIKTSFNNSVAVGSCQAASTTIEALVAELRRSSGCMGSFNLTASYTKNNLTINGNGIWYNFLYIPHRSGGRNGQDSGDNTSYGTLLLFGMTADGAAWRIRVAGGAIAELAKL